MSRILVLLGLMLLGAAALAQLIRTDGVKAGVVAANQDWTYRYGWEPLDVDVRWGIDYELELLKVYNRSLEILVVAGF